MTFICPWMILSSSELFDTDKILTFVSPITVQALNLLLPALTFLLITEDASFQSIFKSVSISFGAVVISPVCFTGTRDPS